MILVRCVEFEIGRRNFETSRRIAIILLFSNLFGKKVQDGERMDVR